MQSGATDIAALCVRLWQTPSTLLCRTMYWLKCDSVPGSMWQVSNDSLFDMSKGKTKINMAIYLPSLKQISLIMTIVYNLLYSKHLAIHQEICMINTVPCILQQDIHDSNCTLCKHLKHSIFKLFNLSYLKNMLWSPTMIRDSTLRGYLKNLAVHEK